MHYSFAQEDIIKEIINYFTNQNDNTNSSPTQGSYLLTNNMILGNNKLNNIVNIEKDIINY